MKESYYTRVKSPVGQLYLASRGGLLCSLLFDPRGGILPSGPEWKESGSPFGEVLRQLEAYFAGELSVFDIPLLLEGTPFQRAAWKELQKIPYGETITYGEQARRMGRPKAARAVGGANGRNPVAIVIPCHRVIGSGGRLTGFGGGLDIKQKLLRLESATGFRPLREDRASR